MTCIVAVKRPDGGIVMGADAAGSDGWTMVSLKDPKIFRVGAMLIGYTTSFRMGQLLGYGLALPEHHQDVPVEKYMASSFIDAVRTCLKNGGYAKRENEIESGGTFLVGYRNRIFAVQHDYAVTECGRDFDACGSGFMLAMGSLHATAALGGLEPAHRVKMALSAAEDFCATVRGPMDVQELEPFKA